MKEETKNWLKYSEENLEAAKLLLESYLYNPCLHNVQQSIEKAIKSVFIEYGIRLKKTHRITELRNILEENSISVDLTEDECDLLDSIYLPSKYPVGSALPDYSLDEEITLKCIAIADRILKDIKIKLNK